MAKVGEGDSRWLVADRSDGKNVGNWHWTEKSLFPWAKEHMEKTLADYVLSEDEKTKVWISSVESFKGDIFVNNRKGKTLYIWDVNMNLRWKAILKGAAEGEEAPMHEAEGRVECIDINVTDDDFDTKFSIDIGDNAQGRELLGIVKSKAANAVKKEWKAMTTLMAELHSNACKVGVNSDAAAGAPASTTTPASATVVPSSSASVATPKSPAVNTSSATPAAAASTASNTSGDATSVRSTSQVVKFETTASLLFETLTDQGRVSAFTGSGAQFSTETGSPFKMFGGSVHGIVEEAVPAQKIVEKWRFASWPAEHYSVVTIEIVDKGAKCVLKLTQTGIPDTDFDRTRLGWEEHFWRRIKGVFGWNYKIKS